MVSYKTTDAEASKKLKDRLRKVLRRVRAAGMWYFFGCLAFIGFAILPLITINGQSIDLFSYIAVFQNGTKLETGDIVLIGSHCVHRPEFEHGLLYERVIIYISPEFLQQQSTPDCPLKEIFSGENGHVLHLNTPDALWSISDTSLCARR